jgi:hypothetical protein
LLTIEAYSPAEKSWITIHDVLADTGADITVLPRYVGEIIVGEITVGRYAEIKGVEPSSVLIAFIHKLKLNVCGREFETNVAIADSNNVPPILGRFKVLDLFDVEFKKGKEVVFKD